MAMKPVGAALLNRKAIGKGRAWLDAGETHARHTVHDGWEQQPMPVNRRTFFQAVRDAQRCLLPFFQTNDGTWNGPVDRHGSCGSPVEEEQLLADRQTNH